MLILIADDDADMCLLTAAMLKSAGHTSVVARDAMQVVTLAMQRKPDMILLDLQMPAGTGIGALEKLKLSSRTAEIPVIVVSGTQDESVKQRALQLGAVGFVPKPVDDAVLLEAVVRAAPSGDR